MLRQIFKKNSKNIVSKVILVLLFGPIVFSYRSHCQERLANLTYFVAPEYPRLARQAMLSGDVHLTVTLNPDGVPKEVTFKAPHDLLGWAAKENVLKWRFDSIYPASIRTRYVVFHYGFREKPRHCDPSTTVGIDIETLNVFVSVDPEPANEGDAF